MSPGGMPIYFDDVPRDISNTAAEIDRSHHDWEPANKVARKLWRCIDALKDVAAVLENVSASESPDKQRRKLKIMLTPLLSLAQGIVDLLNYIECDAETRKHLDPDLHALIAPLRERFLEYVPIERKMLLSTLRNKVSAHVDQSLSPSQARELLSQARFHEVGLWLHASVGVMLDLTKLPIYGWICDSNRKDVVRLMTNEPFLLTITIEEGQLGDLVGLHIVQDAPVARIVKVMEEALAGSRWMFGSTDMRLGNFVEHKDPWPWPEFLVSFPRKDHT